MENKNINCTVNKCKNHIEGKNCCCLSHISIGMDTLCSDSNRCTLCNSFIPAEKEK